LLPLADEEAFWIGVIIPRAPNPSAVILEVIDEDGNIAPVARVEGPTGVIPGIRRPDGTFQTFCRPWLAGIYVSVADYRTCVYPAQPTTYAEVSGRPAPEQLDVSAGYSGWKLP
jgi:hypothetical protein